MIIPGVTFLPFQIDSKNWVKRVIYTAKPDVIIYAIGSNDLEFCETYARFTENLHSIGPATLSSSTEILQPKVIYLSNGYVFDGYKGNYHESDILLPWNTLGRMKVGGENAIRSRCLNYVVIRSSPLFGRSCGVNLSFLDRMRMSLDRGVPFEMSTRELHAFAPVEGLCEMVKRLLESGIKNRIMHYGGLTKVTPFNFGKAFAKRFKYDPNLIIPKKSFQMKQDSHENLVFDYSLNCTQTVETLKIKPFLLEEGLDLINQNLIPAF
jgi:dTDP-4-dehydrorhamnose reductase